MQQKKETWEDLKKRARWDRIFGALAVFLLILILFISGVSSCAKKLTQDDDTKPANVDETLPTSETNYMAGDIVDNSMAVFLSPSTQEDNVYACDNTITEENAMWQIARRVQALLETDGYQVYICGEDDTVMSKVQQGNALKCGAYVAIHSNSSGESGDGQGTEIFYNTNIPGSQALAEYIYNRVANLTPTEDRGVKDQTQRDLYEIERNENACCLLEVEFHDDMTTSQWILNHVEEIAVCIKDGIIDYLKMKAYSTPVTPSESEISGTGGLI
ncbi:MAG: N-acetylmuramoyl-L-alanine amidase [Oscillospiraceae bacterium]|nr:N-acetylmuramoyl-L-alanine amidase [Oscillospiraceae bacterium]